MTKTLIFLFLCGLVFIEGFPNYDPYEYSSDYDNYDGDDIAINEEEENEIRVDINFVNTGTTEIVDRGTTIKLPCYVDKFPENFVILWKRMKDNAIMAMGETVLVENERISVEINKDGPNKGSTLVIPLAEEKDAGQYVCQMANGEQKKLKHTVQIRDPPSITKTPSNGLYKAHKGDDVTLSCIGNGNPKPVITWTRLNKKLPDGKEKLDASEITFRKVNKHHAGTYVCTANNGFGQEVKEKIHLDVEFSPEVEVEEYFIHATEKKQVELVCLVHAHPQATVQWFKNSIELTGDDVKLERYGHKHTLTIPSVNHADYGNYTCRAKNVHGESAKNLEVSGLAGFANFKSAPRGNEPNSFLLEWTSESHTPIEEFELTWRQEDGQWEGFTVEAHKVNEISWAGKHAFTGLSTATRFEVKVSAKNEEGWSRLSPSFHFATFGAEPLTDTGSATQISRSLNLIVTTALVILIAKLL